MAGNEHSPYLEQIVKGLIEKRGMDPGKAYAIARASIRRWGAGSKHPEVRAAAAGAEVKEIAAQERAHAHAGTSAAVELTGPGGWSHGWVYHGTGGMAPEDKADRMSRNLSGRPFKDGADGAEARSAHRLAAKAHRQAAGLSSVPSTVIHHQKMARLHSAVASGRMYSYNAEKKMSVTWDDIGRVLEMAITRVAAGQAGGGQFGSGSGAPVAGPTPAQKAQQKAALLATARDDRAKAAVLGQQRSVLRKALASAGGKVSKGQAGAKTKKSTAPAKKTTAAPAKKTASPAKAKTPSKAPGSAARAAQIVQLKTQIAGLNTQINGLLAAANAATAQAAAIK